MKKFNIEKLPKWAKEKIDFIEWNEYGEIADDAAGIVYTKEQYKFDGGNTVLFFDRKDLLEMLKLFEEEKQNENEKTCVETNEKKIDFKSFFESFK